MRISDWSSDVCSSDLRNRPAGEQVVGTYRLLRRGVAEQHGGFYSASEYDLQPMLDFVGPMGGLLELGRSCVHRDYRTNATIQQIGRASCRESVCQYV